MDKAQYHSALKMKIQVQTGIGHWLRTMQKLWTASAFKSLLYIEMYQAIITKWWKLQFDVHCSQD